MMTFVFLAFAYILGSIPFGIVFARVFGLGDLRQIGSGNIGATNVLRTGHKPAAALTLIFDAMKGGLAVLCARAFGADDIIGLVAFFALLGHCFPIFLAFKGGKGVATFLGTVCVLAWPLGIIACLTWLITAKLSKMSSLSGMGCTVSAALGSMVFGLWALTIPLIGMSALVVWRHKDNISRIKAGTESKIGQKS